MPLCSRDIETCCFKCTHVVSCPAYIYTRGNRFQYAPWQRVVRSRALPTDLHWMWCGGVDCQHYAYVDNQHLCTTFSADPWHQWHCIHAIVHKCSALKYGCHEWAWANYSGIILRMIGVAGNWVIGLAALRVLRWHCATSPCVIFSTKMVTSSGFSQCQSSGRIEQPQFKQVNSNK